MKTVEGNTKQLICCGLLYAILLLVLLKSLLHGDEPRSPIQREPFRVAALQFNPRWGQLEENVDRLARAFEGAAQQGARIIVAPEMATTGYVYTSRQEIDSFVETIPGRTTRRFAQISQQYLCYLAWGMAELDPATGLYYNAMAVVGPQGYLGKYRKTHLWETETHWAAYGNDRPPVLRTPYGSLSLLICQDANYSESFRLALLGGADIVCFATNSSGQTVARLQARAIQNGLYIIGANRCDEEKEFAMRGCSSIWSATGRKLAEASLDHEEVIFAEIDPSQYRMKQTILQHRRPEIYADLVRHIAPWDYSADDEPRRVQAIAMQYTPDPDPDRNWNTIERLLTQEQWRIDSFTRGRTMVVMPELSLVGLFDPENVHAKAESLGGESVERMRQLARSAQCWIVFGMAEKGNERKYYNTAVMLAPTGEIVAKARKMHLNAHDREWAKAGDKVVVVDTEDLGRVGLLVGSDAYVPEAGTLLAIERPSLVAIPSSWHGEVAGDGDIRINPAINPHGKRGAMVLWDNLAWEHLYYVIVANFVGGPRQFLGRSGVYSIDPIYDLQSPALANTQLKDEAVVGAFTTIQKDHWITQEKYISSRRAASRLYYPLLDSPGKQERTGEVFNSGPRDQRRYRGPMAHTGKE
jgi:predicted amidohydrolase